MPILDLPALLEQNWKPKLDTAITLINGVVDSLTVDRDRSDLRIPYNGTSWQTSVTDRGYTWFSGNISGVAATRVVIWDASLYPLAPVPPYRAGARFVVHPDSAYNPATGV